MAVLVTLALVLTTHFAMAGDIVDSQSEETPAVVAPAEDGKMMTATPANLDKLATSAFRIAMKSRQAPAFKGGGMKSGNVGKGLSGAAIRELLGDNDVCKVRGNAIDIAEQMKACRSYVSAGANPLKAEPGSLIFYKSSRFPYGHAEQKIRLTEKSVKAARTILHMSDLKAGDDLYCSDYCRTTPSSNATLTPIAVFSLAAGK